MNKELLVCTIYKSAIFIDSIANKAPRWTGRVGDYPSRRRMIDGQDDLRVFKMEHSGHEMIEVGLI